MMMMMRELPNTTLATQVESPISFLHRGINSRQGERWRFDANCLLWGVHAIEIWRRKRQKKPTKEAENAAAVDAVSVCIASSRHSLSLCGGVSIFHPHTETMNEWMNECTATTTTTTAELPCTSSQSFRLGRWHLNWIAPSLKRHLIINFMAEHTDRQTERPTLALAFCKVRNESIFVLRKVTFKVIQLVVSIWLASWRAAEVHWWELMLLLLNV